MRQSLIFFGVCVGLLLLSWFLWNSESPHVKDDTVRDSVLSHEEKERLVEESRNNTAITEEPVSTLSPLSTTTDTVASSSELVIEATSTEMVAVEPDPLNYTIVDTGQTRCYDTNNAINCPDPDESFGGQDAQYSGPLFSYIDNEDGTITDTITGLVWQQDPGEKVSFADAQLNASSLSLGGHTDWRVPTIKELYSLINFNGGSGRTISQSTPYLDTFYFFFAYGDTTTDERLIDAQYWSNTEYVSTTMYGDATVFGVNFADGRIKGYPKYNPQDKNPNKMFVRFVRDNPQYGTNAFVDTDNGVIVDMNTGLAWAKDDSELSLTWKESLRWCENSTIAGNTDWRLPNAKELQSIVDYARSPDTSDSAAIDPIFNTSTIKNEIGGPAYPFFWTSTTHLEVGLSTQAIYIAFGKALGFMKATSSDEVILMDVHGAGAQRSDPKIGDPSDYPEGHGPQGDVVRIYNYVRCVRDYIETKTHDSPPTNTDATTTEELPVEEIEKYLPPQQGLPTSTPPTPPSDAVEACAQADRGEVCEFSAPMGPVIGTCNMIQSELACVPNT